MQPPQVQPRIPRRRGSALPGWALGALIGIFVIAVGLSAYLVFASVRDLVAGWQVTGHSPFSPDISSDGAIPGDGQPGPNQASTGGGLLPQRWADAERVTILVMGIDRRQGETERGYLTDSMMLVTVDPTARTGAMLSIPRDLWVEIPGYGNNTINTANRSGDYYDYPGGGPALAVQTVEHNLGVDVHYFVRLDFTAFETLIDTIGGIDVDNPTPINDPWYPDGAYGYEPFYLPAGRQHLSGHDALRYARTRHDSSDVERARRQQQVAMAARDRILNLNMLPTLIVQAPALYDTLNTSLQTDLTLNQIISLAILAQDIPRENINSEVIDYRYVLEETTPEGRQVLVPLRDKIRELRDRLFSLSAPIAPPSQADLLAQMQAEGARVEVLNGAGVEGLAKATTDWLVAQQVNVVTFGTADRLDYATTVIVDYSGRPYTTRWLAQIFHTASVLSGSNPGGSVDVRVILGADWRVPGSP